MAASVTRLARVFALGVSLVTLAGTTGAPGDVTKGADVRPAAAHRPTVAVTDWIAADAIRLLAKDDVDVVVVPGLGMASPARSATKPDAKGDEAKVALSDEARGAIDAAEALVSSAEAKELHAAAKDLCPAQGALASAIRAPLRVTREDGRVEPAFWTDAALWARTVFVSRQTLAKVVPEKDQVLKDRAREVRDRLMALNDEMLSSYGGLSRDTLLVVGAEGLGQLGRVHQLDVRVVPASLDTPEQREAMRELVELIVARKTPAAFPVDGVINGNLEELVRRVRARGGELRIAPALHVDTPAPGDDGSPGAVERMIRYNATVVREAFTTRALPTAK